MYRNEMLQNYLSTVVKDTTCQKVVSFFTSHIERFVFFLYFCKPIGRYLLRQANMEGIN